MAIPKYLAPFGVILVLCAIHGTDAFLKPNCTKLEVQVGCTVDVNLANATWPQCVLPFASWISTGRIVQGNSPRPNGVLPSWANRTLVRRGQKVIKEFRYPWYMVIFYGLFFELMLPDISYPLIFNGVHENSYWQAARDIATLMQSLVLIGDEFKRIPVPGKSSYLNSINNTRNLHVEVMLRGQAKIAADGCIINPEENRFRNYDSDNQVFWDAYDQDLADSEIQNRDLPLLQWKECPYDVTCGTCEDCTCNPTLVTDLDGSQYYVGCTGCKNCTSCLDVIPRCRYAQRERKGCNSCSKCSNSTDNKYIECVGCGGCRNDTGCLAQNPVLYNQMAMNLVVYNLVAWPLCYGPQLGINLCDADRAAFLHFWASNMYGYGVDNAYNIFLQPDLTTACNYFEKIFRDMLIPTMFNIDKPTQRLMDEVLTGLNVATAGQLTPGIAMYKFLTKLIGINATNIWNEMSDYERTFSDALDTSYRYQYMWDNAYRNKINTFVTDFSYFASNLILLGECPTYSKMAWGCFVNPRNVTDNPSPGKDKGDGNGGN